MAPRWQQQLPKWHPLHRNPEEQMTPGTERAIMDLARSIPRLSQMIESLAESVKAMALPKQQTPGPKDHVVGALVLTTSQWIELVGAVHSKAISVRKGDYQHPSDYDDEEAEKKSQEEWADELEELEKVLTESLTQQGIGL